MATRKVDEQFGRRVREELERRGIKSMRQADLRTGINHVTLGNMGSGRIPTMETVIRFAQSLDLDLNEWLVLAGYSPISAPTSPPVQPPAPDADDPRARLQEDDDQARVKAYVEAMQERFKAKGIDIDPQVGTHKGGASGKSADELIAWLEAMERVIVRRHGKDG